MRVSWVMSHLCSKPASAHKSPWALPRHFSDLRLFFSPLPHSAPAGSSTILNYTNGVPASGLLHLLFPSPRLLMPLLPLGFSTW